MQGVPKNEKAAKELEKLAPSGMSPAVYVERLVAQLTRTKDQDNEDEECKEMLISDHASFELDRAMLPSWTTMSLVLQLCQNKLLDQDGRSIRDTPRNDKCLAALVPFQAFVSTASPRPGEIYGVKVSTSRGEVMSFPLSIALKKQLSPPWPIKFDNF